MQEFLDEANDGVILFTMGFVFETSFVPKERIDALFSVFERLPQGPYSIEKKLLEKPLLIPFSFSDFKLVPIFELHLILGNLKP